MATKTINANLNMLDSNGDLNVVYPITKKGNITDLEAMSGASSSAAGGEGLVPAPAAGDQAKYLKGDGTWSTPANTTYNPATTSAAGLMSAADKTKLDGIDTGANKYTHPSYTAQSSGLYKVTVDSTGHVSAAASVSSSDLSSFGLSATATELNYTDGVTSNIQTQLNAKAALASPTFTGTPTAPTAASGTNTTQIATTAFVTTAIDNVLSASDAMVFKGTIGTSGTVTALPASHQVGDTYKVATAGSYAGVTCEVGDMIICVTTGTTASNTDWTVVQANIDGAVTGPTSAVTDRVAVFNGTTGKIIKDSGYTIATSVPSGAKFTDTTYSDMTGASSSAAGTSGLVPAPASGKQASFLRGDGTWVVPTNTTYSPATTSANGLMSSTDKAKLDGIESGANAYTHPSYTAKSSGLYKVTVDATGHVSAAATVAKSDITALGIPAQDTTYSTATTSAAGLMSASDKSRLDTLPNTYISTTQPTALKAGDLWIQPVE